MRRPGANRRGIRGFGGRNDGVEYLLDYADAAFTRVTGAAFAEPRDPANGGTGAYAGAFVSRMTTAQKTDYLAASVNLITDTWDDTTGGAAPTTGQADPTGGTSAVLLTDNAAGSSEYAVTTQGVLSADPAWKGVAVKKDAGTTTFLRIELFSDAALLIRAAFDQTTGALTFLSGGGGATKLHVAEIDGWYWIAWKVATLNNPSIRVYPAAGLTASFPTLAASSQGSATVYEPFVVDASTVALSPTPWADDHEPRIFSDGAILIEGARENVSDNSADIDGTGWGGAGTRTLDDATAPDGSVTADLITNSGTALDACRRYSEITTTLAAVASGYVKASVGTEASIAAGNAGSNVFTTTSEYQRVSVYNAAATGSKRAELYNLDLGGVAPGAQTGNSGDANHWWGTQVEEAAFASSPIRTAGAAATRAPDDASWASATAAQVAAFNGSWYIDYWPKMDSTVVRDYTNARLLDFGGNKLSLYSPGTTGAAFSLNSGGTVLTGGAPAGGYSAGDHLRLHCTSIIGGASSVQVENITTGNIGTKGTGSTGGTVWAVGDKITIGNYTSGSFYSFGAISQPVAA